MKQLNINYANLTDNNESIAICLNDMKDRILGDDCPRRIIYYFIKYIKELRQDKVIDQVQTKNFIKAVKTKNKDILNGYCKSMEGLEDDYMLRNHRGYWGQSLLK